MSERFESGPAKLETLLDREILKEVRYPHEHLDNDLIEKWGDGIPTYSEADPTRPEWRETPVIPLDLTKEGYGEIEVKNEADRESNPTGTIKDRAAWEIATLYCDVGRAWYLKLKAGTRTRTELEREPTYRFSFITSGNEGRAVAEIFAKYDLPPPKLLVDKNTSRSILEELKKLRADIYLVDLSLNPWSGEPAHDDPLTPEQIKTLTNNQDGIDITSVRSIESWAVFYDWHVHETFNRNPHEIYVPYGSGRLMENYLYWQERTARNDFKGIRDPRLKTTATNVISMSILGAEPREPKSRADKLTAPTKPFRIFEDEDITALGKLNFTGRNTKRTLIDEEHLRHAQELFTQYGIEAEPSGAAGLALYLERFENKSISDGEKITIVNTGKGLEAKEEAI